MLRSKPSSALRSVVRPAWAEVSPFPSHLLTRPRHTLEGVLLLLLFLTTFSGAIVSIDILYSVLSVVSAGLFLLLGLRLDRRNLPLILLLIVFNAGGFLSLQIMHADEEARAFMVGSSFVGITAIFFAMALNENAIERLGAIKWGTICGALVASLVGLLGFAGIIDFGLLQGGRLAGTFGDPNVYGSFAAASAVFLASDLLNDPKRRVLKLLLLLPLLGALFLSFSRGSWGNVAMGLAILFVLTYFTTKIPAMRARLLLAALVGVALVALALVFLLANDDIRTLFADRFVLQKDYDSGPAGRFGSQLRAIPDLLGRPFGHGPLQFAYFYPEDPHNAYLAAFSYFGWLGGIAFWCFILATILVSLRAALTRSPFQPYAIALFAMLIPHLVQNIQIDTFRWRHLYMIYGLCWGIAAITSRYTGEYLTYAHAAYRAAAGYWSKPPAPPDQAPASNPA